MADLCAELRAKCTDDLHRKFHTFALASGKEGAEVLRELAQVRSQLQRIEAQIEAMT